MSRFLKIIFPALAIVFFFVSYVQISYAISPGQFGFFQPYINTAISYLSDFVPSLKISKPFQPVVFAQTAGFGGGSGALTMYFLETNGVSQYPSTCPTGWSEALYGYGPHYLGIIANDWLQNGTKGNGGGFWNPSVPPPIPDTNPPTIGGPGGGPGGPGGTSEGEPPPPGSGPGEGGVSAPENGSGLPNPFGMSNKNHPVASKDDKNLLALLFPKARAQVLLTVYTEAVAIGSDSVCSQSNREVVTTRSIFNNTVYQPQKNTYADACFTNPSTGVTECNRCRVCTKP